jgi:hypothetical protein
MNQGAPQITKRTQISAFSTEKPTCPKNKPIYPVNPVDPVKNMKIQNKANLNPVTIKNETNPKRGRSVSLRIAFYKTNPNYGIFNPKTRIAQKTKPNQTQITLDNLS